LGSFREAGVNDNPWAVDVDWGDASPHTIFSAATQGALGMKSHTYADNGSYTVTVKVTDKDLGYDSKTFTVTVNNLPPVVTAPANQSANEGASTSFGLGSFSDAGVNDNPWAVDVDWGDSSSHTTFSTAAQGPITAQNHAYDDNTTPPATGYTVTVKVTDKDGAFDSKTFKVTVSNVAPTATLSNNGPVNEGSPATISFSAPSDPSSADTSAGFHYAFDCAGGALSAAYATAGMSASTMCTYPDNGSYPVRARILDKDGGYTDYSTVVTVLNVAPTATLSNNGPVNEASPATISFSAQFDQSSADAAAGFHYAYSCSNASPAGVTYAGSGAIASTSCAYAEGPSTHTVRPGIIDKDGGYTEYSTVVAVNNVAPT